MADTSTMGSSSAMANWLEVEADPLRGCLEDGGSGVSATKECGRQSHRIRRHADEGLGVDANSYDHHSHHCQRDRLRHGNSRALVDGRLLEPCMHDDAEIVVQRRNDVHGA